MICRAFSGVLCLALAGSVTAAELAEPFQVSVNVATGSCELFTGGAVVAYDSLDPIDNNQDVVIAFVRCGNGVAWTLAGDAGQHASSNSCIAPGRRMAQGAAHLGYGLYRDPAYMEPFGCDPATWITGTGFGDYEIVPGYLNVPAGQSPAADGIFEDSILVTLTF